jgi:para-nitrobenzyl esterase
MIFFQKLPVLVFIYGGGFTTGSSTQEGYNPSVLVTRGNIVFVSMQYRLGAFGFLSMGQVSHSQHFIFLVIY